MVGVPAVVKVPTIFSHTESDRAAALPFRLHGKELTFSPKTTSASSLYAAIHSSTSISSRPSMTATSLLQRSIRLVVNRSTHLLMLVPPIRPNTSHGFAGRRLLFFRLWFSRSILLFKMWSVESLHLPPPSSDSRHRPVVSKGFGFPPNVVDSHAPYFNKWFV
jgi:hypothetical protein